MGREMQLQFLPRKTKVKCMIEVRPEVDQDKCFWCVCSVMSIIGWLVWLHGVFDFYHHIMGHVLCHNSLTVNVG